MNLTIALCDDDPAQIVSLDGRRRRMGQKRGAQRLALLFPLGGGLSLCL